MNAIQNLVSQQQPKSKNQFLEEIDCSYKIIKDNGEIKDEMTGWFSSPNQRLGSHLLRVLIKRLLTKYHYNEVNSQSPLISLQPNFTVCIQTIT